MTIYLDNNATTQPAPEVIEAMASIQRESWANPSSVHRLGQQARQQIELAREAVARLIGATPREVVFTSGGTESVALSINGLLQQQHRRSRPALVTSRIEHSAVRELAEHRERNGHPVHWVGADRLGVVDIAELQSILDEHAASIALVSIMWANNETGVIQPIEAIGAMCREHGVLFHTDAVQWVGKMPCDVSSLPIDLMSFSGHKFHGPKAVGGLYLRRGIRIEPRQLGGPQELGRRGGTENVAGIMGLAAAAKGSARWLATEARAPAEARRDRFERAIQSAVDGAVVNGGAAPRLWNTTNIAFPGLEAEPILLLCSERGLCASAGAACSSGSVDASPVLLAMGGAAELVHGSVRFSISRHTTDEEIDQAVEVLTAVVHRLGAKRPTHQASPEMT